jgi:transposase InsO family protein
MVPLITALVATRPTYGYRRITAILNCQLRVTEVAPVNRKRVYRIMQGQNLLLARRYSERPDRTHNGKIVTMRSNLRWCGDGFEFTCWNRDIVRGAFIINAHDREIIAWCAVVKAGIAGSDVCDIMLAAVEARFAGHRTPHQIEMLTDNGSPYVAKDTRIVARQLGLKPCYTPVNITPLPNAATVLGLISGWFEDYNENHPHSGLKMRSPREYIAAQIATT